MPKNDPRAQTAMLAIESHTVIDQRVILIAKGGPKAWEEARLMVSAKVAAQVEAKTPLSFDGSASHAWGRYRRRVKANTRRLSINR